MISVVVCTYNRHELLSKCLASLADQSISKDLYEVIVADNDSNDDTMSVVQRYVEQYPNFRLCSEIRRGANHARNAGVAVAKGEYVAFIDDDALASSDWLFNIYDFLARHTDVVVFGGPYDAYSVKPTPEWFPPEYGSLYLGPLERTIEIGKEWITGTNLIVKRDAFLSVGGFHEKLGSVINGVFYFGEESRLLVDLREQDHFVYYVPTIKVKHLIRSDKMSLRYLLVSGYRMGRHHGITLNEKRSLLNHMISISAAVVKASIKIIFAIDVPFKRRLYYGLNPVFYEVGALVEYITLRTNL